MIEWLQLNTFLKIPAYQWLLSSLVTIAAYITLHFVWRISLNRFSRIAEQSNRQLDEIVVGVLRSTRIRTLMLFALLIGFHFLDIPQKWANRLDHLSFLIVGIQIAIWFSEAITIWAHMQITRHSTDGEAPNTVITAILAWVFKAVVWSIVLLAILSNIGINITAFIASLGIGGVAVALAVQNILSDLFASLAIGLDKPFVIGDFVVFGDVSGTIEKVGLKTTHIRSISGEQIVCSNTELLKNTIHNYKRMSKRRVEFGFGVTYETPPEVLAGIPAIVKTAITRLENTRFDRAHFNSFGPSSLDFVVVYFISSSDFNLYMDIQQAINLYIMEKFQEINVEFAYPTTTLHVDSLPAELLGSSSKKADQQ